MTSTPKRFPDRDEIASVRAEADALEPSVEGSEQRRLAGRVLARRDMGKLVFLDLVDRSGDSKHAEPRRPKQIYYRWGGNWPHRK